MNKLRILVTLLAAVSMQGVWAHDEHMTNDTNRPCGMLAKACLDAGYGRNENTDNKRFWEDCMKPILLGKSVSDVKIDASTVKACRVDKVDELKKELKELQDTMSKSNN